MLFELVTGLPPLVKDTNNEDGTLMISLVCWVEHLTDNIPYLVDPILGENYDELAMKLLVKLAKNCTKRYGKQRPTMDEICYDLTTIKKLILSSSEGQGTSSVFSEVVSTLGDLPSFKEESSRPPPVSEDFLRGR